MIAVLVLAVTAAAEQVFEDSAALTTLWQATSSGQTGARCATLTQALRPAYHPLASHLLGPDRSATLTQP